MALLLKDDVDDGAPPMAEEGWIYTSPMGKGANRCHCLSGTGEPV